MQQGIEYVYDRGTIYVYDGRIYRLDIPLPEHMRRSEALLTLGFPEQVDKYLITHREYVLENEWAFRRLRMMRVSKENGSSRWSLHGSFIHKSYNGCRSEKIKRPFETQHTPSKSGIAPTRPTRALCQSTAGNPPTHLSLYEQIKTSPQ